MESKPLTPGKVDLPQRDGRGVHLPAEAVKQHRTVSATGYLWDITVTASEATGEIHIAATCVPGNRDTTLSRISAAVEGQALWLIERGVGEG